MPLHWDEKYNLGNEKIDAEHHIFLDLIVEFDSLATLGAWRCPELSCRFESVVMNIMLPS
jgi:hypothetical protein